MVQPSVGPRKATLASALPTKSLHIRQSSVPHYDRQPAGLMKSCAYPEPIHTLTDTDTDREGLQDRHAAYPTAAAATCCSAQQTVGKAGGTVLLAQPQISLWGWGRAVSSRLLVERALVLQQHIPCHPQQAGARALVQSTRLQRLESSP
jgi:hypothetical protein